MGGTTNHGLTIPLFINEMLKCGDISAAARAVGITRGTARQYLEKPEVQEEINRRRKQVADSVDYDVGVAMEEAKEAMVFAKETENANAYVKAVELRSKLQGLLVDRHDIRSLGQFQINIVGLDAPQASVAQLTAIPMAILEKPQDTEEDEADPFS